MQSISKLILAGLIAGVFLLTTGAEAHHSGAMFADSVMEITGTIKQFQWTNPHTWIQVNVESAGSTKEWSIEWGSPNNLGRQGIRPTSFPAGAKVTMRINPMRDGTAAGGFVAAKFADGKVIGNWR
jgi:hypothetical protein